MSLSQYLLAKVWVMLIEHYICGISLQTQSRGKTITKLHPLAFLSPTALLAQDFFTSCVLLQCVVLPLNLLL